MHMKLIEVALPSLSNMVSVVSSCFVSICFFVGDGRDHGQLTPKMKETSFDFVPAVSGVMTVTITSPVMSFQSLSTAATHAFGLSRMAGSC